MTMSLTELKQEVSHLPSKQQRELIAYLVALQTQRDEHFKKELAEKIDDRDSAHWMELNDLEKRYDD
jgi:hypothetical protein